MYKIVLTQRALRDLENIDKEMKNELLQNSENMPENIFNMVKN